MNPSRRVLLVGASALIPATFLLSACTPVVTFKQVQGYVATAVAALDKLAPEVEALDPAIAPQLNAIVAQVDAAGAAFAALTGPPSGLSTVETMLAFIEDGLSIAAAVPGIPPAAVAIIEGVDVLLVTIGTFFNLNPPSTTALRAANPQALSSFQQAVNAYEAAKDKRALADSAQAQVRAWLAS